MLPLGTPAPHFALPNVVDGTVVSLDDFRGMRGLLVMFICNHCPYVKHVREELARLGRDAHAMKVGVVAISSNNVETHPDDSPDHMREEARNAGYTFPYLYDESQEVAGAYRAACTPDFFLFDKDLKLAYRGQLDDSRPRVERPLPVTGKDLRAAIDAVVAGQQPDPNQKPSIGCNIKWKPGKEPV